MVLDYLASLFESGLKYRTINLHRSAISAYHVSVDGYAIGRHPKVCSLLKGVFNCRTPQPKYSFIWDVDVVLTYLKSLKGDLSNKLLTVKLAMLLALSGAFRGHELQYLDIRFMSRSNRTVRFDFCKLTKGWKNGDPPPYISFESYPHDDSLCPVSTLDAYLARSRPWRGVKKSQLFLGFQNPHNEITSSTLARWIKFVLRESGVNTNIFQAHSSRSASTSKVSSNLALNGLSVKDILNKGNWSRESTWQKFYNRSLGDTSPSFVEAVLS